MPSGCINLSGPCNHIGNHNKETLPDVEDAQLRL
jgi:hypothetical protein